VAVLANLSEDDLRALARGADEAPASYHPVITLDGIPAVPCNVTLRP
jgi:hypothetical protein